MRFTLTDLLLRLVAAFRRPKPVNIEDEPTPQQALPAASLTLVERPLDGRATVGIDIDTGKPVLATVSAPEPSGRQWHDLRGEPRPEKRGRSHGTRDWSKIKGITIHQTAVDFGTNPRRLLNVPVHGATLRDGSIVLLHDPRAYMWHGHSFNAQDIGIEVSCRAAGLLDDPRTAENESRLTLWLPQSIKEKIAARKTTFEDELHEATDEQLEATKELVRYYVRVVEEHGGKIEFIHAHRQSSKSRVSDPGERIWKAVGIWAQEELGLSAGPPGWSAGGLPLPDAWTGEPNGVRYNWQVDGRISATEGAEA